jgi:CheY-like chemotaxis protein
VCSSDLGLVICKNIIEMMDGRIWVESPKGIGSTFKFTVWLRTVQDDHKVNEIRVLKGLKVLLADDNATSRRILTRVLESWNFTVESAENGDETLREFDDSMKTDKPFELLLLDWKMPGSDGLRIASVIQEGVSKGVYRRSFVVIMVSPFGRDYVRSSVGRIRVDAILDKPITPSRLFDTLICLQTGKTTACQEISLNEKQRLIEKASPLAGARVLLVEDNKVNQQVARELMECVGLHVTIADNGREAIEKTSIETFDIILMDLQMPEIDGYEATARIRSSDSTRDIPIIALTAAAMAQDKDACHAAGMNDHLSKPVEPDDLLDTLLRWIPPKRPLDVQPVTGYNDGIFTLPGFDLVKAAHRMAGNWTLLRKTLGTFVEEFLDSPGHLDQLIKEKKFADAEWLVHSIKGASGNIGAVNLYERALEL